MLLVAGAAAGTVSEYRIELSGEHYTPHHPCGWSKEPVCKIGAMWPGTGYWRVQGRTPSGLETDWSEAWQFVVQPEPQIRLIGSVNLSSDTFVPGERVEGSFTIRNDGQDEWRPRRLGIGFDGPTYVDLGWRENLVLRPGESVTFEGVLPNAPDAPGIYVAFATWQADDGQWRSLGGTVPFRIREK